MPDLLSVSRHIFGCIYIYTYVCGFAANRVLQVAVVVSVCFVALLFLILVKMN